MTGQRRAGITGAFEAAEQAFIVGLPTFVTSTVMDELAIKRSSAQFKAAFNTIWNDRQFFAAGDISNFVAVQRCEKPETFPGLLRRSAPPAAPKIRWPLP